MVSKKVSMDNIFRTQTIDYFWEYAFRNAKAIAHRFYDYYKSTMRTRRHIRLQFINNNSMILFLHVVVG